MKSRRSKTASKPLEIADGNVSVRIVPEKNVVNASTYERFNLIYFEGNERIRRRFSDLATAKTEANLIVTKLANRESEVLKLSPADRPSTRNPSTCFAPCKPSSARPNPPRSTTP